MIFPRIYAIHDQAVTLELGNEIDVAFNLDVINLKNDIETNPFDGFIECVPAYSSLTVYFDEKTTSNTVVDEIKNRHQRLKFALSSSAFNKTDVITSSITNTIIIPVCYDIEYGTDLVWLSDYLKLSIHEIIALHTKEIFRVYMIGFIPGFAYMGTLPKQLESPRKETPASSIPIGSVAIAGKQTGIYPADVPGGWQIIGRTPMVMFDKNRNPSSLLKAGDQVQFKSITKQEFESQP